MRIEGGKFGLLYKAKGRLSRRAIKLFKKKRGWAWMAHERIACGCSACLWGMATLEEFAGEIKVYSGGWCYEGR